MRGNEKARDRMGERWNDAGRKKGGSVGQRRRKHGDVWFTWLLEGLGWQFPAMRPIWWEQSNYYSTLSSGNNKLVREPDWETTKDGTKKKQPFHKETETKATKKKHLWSNVWWDSEERWLDGFSWGSCAVPVMPPGLPWLTNTTTWLLKS